MENLEKREKILVIAGSILIVFYLYFNFFLQPAYLDINKELEKINIKKAEFATIEKLKVDNIKNSKKLDTSKKKFENSIKALPKNERNPEISYNLNVLALNNKVKLNSVSFSASSALTSKSAQTDSSNSKDSSSGKLMMLPVALIINGDYQATLDFIKSIETDSRLSEIVSISMATRSDLKSMLQSNITLNYYYSEGTKADTPTYDIKDDTAGKSNLFN